MEYKTHPQYPKQIILKEMKHWYISLWENQYYLGRASIEFKDLKVKNLSELNEDEALELFLLIKGYEKALQKAFNVTNFNWTCLMNNSYKEKNVNKPEPLHLHVWPRYKEETIFNGAVFKDEIFGHHYDKQKEKVVEEKFLIELADKILESWND